MKKAKSPKILADALLWIHQNILEFGIKGLNIKELIEFVKICLGNTNQAVRNNGVSIMGLLRMFIGPGTIACTHHKYINIFINRIS